MFKEGAWIVAEDGGYQWITEHARWLQNPDRARALGLADDVIARIAAIPWDFNGPGRIAICLEGMRHGLIRFRGHGDSVTFESVLPLGDLICATRCFMETMFGPFTLVRVNRLDTGESWQGTYRDIEARGQAGMVKQ